MKTRAEKTAVVDVEIPNRLLAQSLLARWSDCPGVSLSMLRGRIAPDRARFVFEVRGASEGVAEILRQSAAWDLPGVNVAPA
jgi:hypothetical protein